MNHRYVKHMSGRGQRWLLLPEEPDHELWWWAREPREHGESQMAYRLPKTEYTLCEAPPVSAVDVTAECDYHVQDSVVTDFGRGRVNVPSSSFAAYLRHTASGGNIQTWSNRERYEVVKVPSSLTPCFIIRERRAAVESVEPPSTPPVDPVGPEHPPVVTTPTQPAEPPV